MSTAMWTTAPLLGFDTETTGVDPAADRIVSAALVHRTPDVETTVRTWLVDPGIEIPDGAAAIHRISTEQARTYGRPPREALEEIAAVLHEALAEGVPVVAFNAGFDLVLLDAELSRHGLRTLPERLGGPVPAVVDPLVLDRALVPLRRGGRTLGALCAAYGVLDLDGPEAAGLHAADADVVATLDLLAAMVAAFPQLAAIDLATLHAYQVDQHRAWTAELERWRAREAASSSTAPPTGRP
ncbi:exonuclease domain-containing protein [Luteimicrobium album]|nr:exonuclease domain-containing protein [Luteimicrobium album]